MALYSRHPHRLTTDASAFATPLTLHLFYVLIRISQHPVYTVSDFSFYARDEDGVSPSVNPKSSESICNLLLHTPAEFATSVKEGCGVDLLFSLGVPNKPKPGI